MNVSRNSLKDRVKDFWNRNVCQVKFIHTSPGTKAFFEEAERIRYKYHYHLPPLLKEMAHQCGSNGKFLEIGCGMGTDSLEMARKGISITAIDLTNEAIRLSRKRFKMYDFQANLIIGDAEVLPFQSNEFDVVYSFGVLHHTPNTEKSIQEIRRVLKKGGYAYIMLYNKMSLNWLAHWITRTSFDAGVRGERCPLEKAYKCREVKELFKKFLETRISVEYLFGTGWGIINKFIPAKLHRMLGEKIGWHIMIRAIK